MVDERRLAASALGGKTARACDGCLKKRARWFCPADDAFLCQVCDASVHLANQLASRHERVRLETASSSSRSLVKGGGGLPMSPAWHQGFTRKARTPRHGKNTKSIVGREQQSKIIKEKMLVNHLPLVPEIGSEEDGMLSSSMVVDNDSEEDRFPFRVPVFDPFDEELGDILARESPEMEVGNEEGKAIIESYYRQEKDDDLHHHHHHHHQIIGLEDFPGFQLPSDMDLAKFAADVEHLLGSEFDDDDEESLQNKDMDFADFEGGIDGKISFVEKGIKVKDEAVTDGHCDRLLLDHWNFELPVMDEEARCEDEEEEKVVPLLGMKQKKNMLLRLNYESVISAWASQGSSWTTGSRPHQLISPNHCLPNCTGTCPKDAHQPYGGLIGCRSGGGGGEGREARVLRYKEKRRNRLFSKKIRYEVRKLNAEKRPRMKGRFVKRSSFNVGTTNFP